MRTSHRKMALLFLGVIAYGGLTCALGLRLRRRLQYYRHYEAQGEADVKLMSTLMLRWHQSCAARHPDRLDVVLPEGWPALKGIPAGITVHRLVEEPNETYPTDLFHTEAVRFNQATLVLAVSRALERNCLSPEEHFVLARAPELTMGTVSPAVDVGSQSALTSGQVAALNEFREAILDRGVGHWQSYLTLLVNEAPSRSPTEETTTGK